MNTEMLDTLNDDALREVITRAQDLLKQHDRERKEQALAQARAVLSSVGLSLKAVAGKGARPAAGYKGGRLYRHPAKPELVWNAKGQKPNWLRALEREGGKAVEVAQPQAAASEAVEVGNTAGGRRAG
jgi:hypothetical protein